MTNPRKILHVMNSASGGAAISTLALMRELRKSGIASAAVCHPAGSREELQAVTDATEGEALFTLLYYWNRKFRSPWYQRPKNELKQGVRTGWARLSARRAARHASRVGADLVHTNTILNPEGGLAARMLGLPHVWHLRELIGPGAWFQLPLEGTALREFFSARCSRLVANSETAAAGVRAAVAPELLTVVHNGIDISRFSVPASRPPGPLVVGMVANLASHVKKHWLFIEAAARVDPALDVEFRIYGGDPVQWGGEVDDPYVRGLRERVARLGLEKRLRFAGFHPDPVAMMREIDILAHPSDLESFGRIIAEAMAASLPVVGVRGGAAAELVNDQVTGLLAAPEDAQGFAAAIERVVRSPELRISMGAAGRRRVEARYSLDRHVAGMLAVYSESMSRPLGRPRAAPHLVRPAQA